MGIRYINVDTEKLSSFFKQLDLFMEAEGWKNLESRFLYLIDEVYVDNFLK